MVELMIATALGLVISLLAVNYLLTSLQSKSINASYSYLKDNGAVGLYFLAKYARSAGIDTVPILGDDGITAGACKPADLFCSMNSNSTADRFAIRKVLQEDSVACNGEPITLLTEIVEIFSLQDFGDYKALVCQSYDFNNKQWLGSSTKRVLQNGIDDFQVAYYLADEIEPKNADDVTSWSNVQGVEVSILANSQVESYNQNYQQSFVLLDRSAQSYNDRLARQIFQTTIAFNNKVLLKDPT